jgi:Ca-activated chloride channel family protein
MSFAHPWVLLLLIIPAVMLYRHARSMDRRSVVWPVDFSHVGSSRWLAALIGCAESLPIFLVAAVVVLLAGPERLGQPISRRVLSNIEMCVDVSGSMTAPFGEGSRYDGSMKAINEFIDFRTGDAFGMTFFGNNVLHWVPLTSDISALKCSPPFMRPERLPPWFGGTMVGKAVDACRKILVQREDGDRIIILVTDGISMDLMNGNDVELAKELVKDRIVLFAIHVADGDAPGPIVNLSQLTGGEVFEAGDPDGLREIFHKIDSMQKTRLERSSPERQDFYAPVSAAALASLGLFALSLFGLRYTPW